MPNTFYFFSEGILDQISIALYFIILAPEFERAFGKQIVEFWYSCIIWMNIWNEVKIIDKRSG